MAVIVSRAGPLPAVSDVRVRIADWIADLHVKILSQATRTLPGCQLKDRVATERAAVEVNGGQR
jgi:hypothetical protein